MPAQRRSFKEALEPVLYWDATFAIAFFVEIEAKKMELDQMTLNLPISGNIRDQAFRLMRGYGLLPTDSYHIATALDAGVEAFITLDKDFLRVEEIIVYTCLP